MYLERGNNKSLPSLYYSYLLSKKEKEETSAQRQENKDHENFSGFD